MFTNFERKEIISKLQGIKDKYIFIDFLREYFSHEFAIVFEEEIEEKIKIAQSRYNFFNAPLKGFDIRVFTFYRLLQKHIPEKYGINSYYVQLEIIKNIIFFEYLILPIESKKENFEKNRKIKEGREVYNFYRALLSDTDFQIGNHIEAIKVLGFEKLTQQDLDNDKRRSMHDFLSRFIQKNYFPKFIDEYKNFV